MPTQKNIMHSIQQAVDDNFNRMVAVRRELHRHPERSGQELKTAAFLADQLTSLGLPVKTGVGGHGLVADLITDPNKPTIALRVDIDALPIQEINKTAYRSVVPGLMHACGHDVHSAIGIGTAAVLAVNADHLPGNVRFIFQPEEEEITGALRMIHAGVLTKPKPKAIFGLHVAPLPVPKIAWTDDLFLAGFEHFLVALKPMRGYPLSLHHLNTAAQHCCHAINRLNHWILPETWGEMQVFWQHMQAGHPKLKHFILYDASQNEEDPDAWPGQFGVGIKAANRHLRIAALGKLRRTLTRICANHKVAFLLKPVGSMMDMCNNSRLVHQTLPDISNSIGAENLVRLKAAFPFNCEDFAIYTKYLPGAMYWLGAANPDEGKNAILHTPDFDVDERCLITGAAAMVALALSALSQIKP